MIQVVEAPDIVRNKVSFSALGFIDGEVSLKGISLDSGEIKKKMVLHLLILVLGILSSSVVKAEDPYKFYTWTVTYGTASPLGVPQQIILINGQFPGPRLDVVTNDNIILKLINKLDQPFLLTWNGIKQRKNSWQDGVLGTNCPIPPNSNFTYKFQPKDQIGGYTYFPSTGMHKAAGGFGAINVYARPRIPVPYAIPAADFNLLIGDWYKSNHKRDQGVSEKQRLEVFWIACYLILLKEPRITRNWFISFLSFCVIIIIIIIIVSYISSISFVLLLYA